MHAVIRQCYFMHAARIHFDETGKGNASRICTLEDGPITGDLWLQLIRLRDAKLPLDIWVTFTPPRILHGTGCLRRQFSLGLDQAFAPTLLKVGSLKPRTSSCS